MAMRERGAWAATLGAAIAITVVGVGAPLADAGCHWIIPSCPGPIPIGLAGGFVGSASGVSVVGTVLIEGGETQANGTTEASIGDQGVVQVTFLVVHANATGNTTLNVTVDLPDAQDGVNWLYGPDRAFDLNTSTAGPLSVYAGFEVTDHPHDMVAIPIVVTIHGEAISAMLWFAEVTPPPSPPPPPPPETETTSAPMPGATWVLIALALGAAVLVAARRRGR